jgi:hypothetical protein
MFDVFMKWVHEPGNLDILKTAGAALTTIVGAGVWLWDRYEKKKEEDRKKQRATRNKVPANELPQNKKQQPVRTHWAKSIWPQYLATVIIAIGAAGIVSSVLDYRKSVNAPPPPPPPPQVTTEIRVCTGEYEANCGFPHDLYLYCYVDVAAWAQGQCKSFSITKRGEHGGNRCGYSNLSILCTRDAPR